MRKKFLASLVSVFMLNGCVSTAPDITQNHSYKVTWIGTQPIDSYISMAFDVDGRVYGTGGCNHWFAGYGIEGEILRFSRIGSTKRACEAAVMQHEQQFFDALGHVRRWDFSPSGELRLWPEQGKPIRLHAE
ncbi:MAG: META domain-containing protein [Pseudomonas sp.]